MSACEEIKVFEKKAKKYQRESETESIMQMVVKQKKYNLSSKYANYLNKKQPHISWIKRAIVLNWMIEVLTSFGNKRETFAVAVNLLDRYLASSKPIPLQKLQLIAGTCILVANKLEDRLFDVYDLFEAMGSNYSLDEILQS